MSWEEIKPVQAEWEEVSTPTEGQDNRGMLEKLAGAVAPTTSLVGASFLKAASAVPQSLGFTDVAERMRQDAEAARRGIQEVYPVEPGTLPSMVRSGVSSAATQAPLIAAAAATGNPALALALMGGMTAAEKYSNLRGEGVPATKAVPAAAVQGAVEVVTEKVPFGAFLNLFKTQGKAQAKEFLKLQLSEQLGEQAATLSDQITDLVDPKQSFEWNKAKLAAIETAGATAVSSILFGAAGVAGSRMAGTQQSGTEGVPTFEVVGEDKAKQRRRQTTKPAPTSKMQEAVQEQVKQMEQLRADAAIPVSEDTQAAGVEELVTPTPEAALEEETTKPEWQDFVLQRVQELGSEQAVREAYPLDDKVGVYARETAKQLYGQAPSVQNLNEAPAVEQVVEDTPLSQEELEALNRLGYPVLADTPIPKGKQPEQMSDDELEVRPIVKGEVAKKTPAEWRALLNAPAPVATPEEMQKAMVAAQAAQQIGMQMKSRRRDMQTLQQAGYSAKQIKELDASGRLEKTAAAERGEQVSVELTEEKVPVLTELEAATRFIADQLAAGKEVDPVLLAMTLQKMNEADMDEVVEPLAWQTKYTYFEQIDPETGTSPSALEYLDRVKKTRRAFDDFFAKRRAKRGKAISAPTEVEEAPRVEEEEAPRPARRRGRVVEEAENWEQRLTEEGMPSELDFGEEREEANAKAIKDLAELDAIAEESSTKSKAEFDKTMRDKRVFTSDLEALNTIIRGYRYKPKNIFSAEAQEHRQLLARAEEMAAPHLGRVRKAYNAKKIAELVRTGKITRTEARYLEAIASTMKQQPTFALEIESGMKDALGTYGLMSNLINLKDVKVAAHEVMHWGFYNVLTPQERLSYYDSYLQTFYDSNSGKPKKMKMIAATSSPQNAYKGPSEMFASRGSDVTNQYALTPEEKTLFSKIFSWFKDLMMTMQQRFKMDLSAIDQIFNKIIETDATRRRDWPSAIDTARVPTQGEVLDMAGVRTVNRRLKGMLKMQKTASQNNKGKQILREIQGELDWGIPWDTTKVIYAPTKDRRIREAIARHLLSPLRSPLNLVKGTLLEGHVYSMNLAEMAYSFHYNQHATHLKEITKGRSDAEMVEITKYLRETMEKGQSNVVLTAEQMDTANEIRVWLELMRAKHKMYLTQEYKKYLSKTEYNAFLDISNGMGPEEVALKYPKLDTKTVLSIVEKYDEIDNWGLDDYIPNVEMGKYKIVQDAVAADGKPYRKLRAIALSPADAERKAALILQQDPTITSLTIDTDFKDIVEDKTSVTAKQWHAMVMKLQKQLMADIEGIEQGVAKKMATTTLSKRFSIKPNFVYSEFLQDRRDVLKGEDNILPVLYKYAMTMEKKWALDPVIDDVKRSLNKMTGEQRTFIQEYVADVKGRYTAMDKKLDDILGSINSTQFMRDVGWALPEGRVWSRGLAKIRTAEAILKLGFRPVAAGINLASGQMHTWVKVGMPYMQKAYAWIQEKEGQNFIKSVEPYLGTSIIDLDVGMKPTTPKWHPLYMFQKPEPFNRAMSVAANYLFAIDELKLSKDAARHYAIRANMEQQFTYNMANLPLIMRGPVRKTLMQFKPYLIKEIEFMSSMTPKEWTRYAGMQLMLGGPRGYVMILRSLPFLAMFGFWDDLMDMIEQWMNKEMPIASRGIAATPSLIMPELGIDMTAAATFQFPNSWEDFMGPFLSDLYRLNKDVLQPLSTYGFYTEDAKKALNVAAIARHWTRIIDNVIDRDGWVKDEQGRKMYQIPNEYVYFMQNFLGVESLELSRNRLAASIENRQASRDVGIRTRLINSFLRDVVAGRPITDDFRDRMIKYGVTGEAIMNSQMMRELPLEARQILRSEVRRRPEVIRWFPRQEDLGFGSEVD